jgi:hypothetical protein
MGFVPPRLNTAAFLLSFAAVGTATAILLMAGGHTAQPSDAEMRAALLRHIHELAPGTATACGLVPLSKESSAARACADQALKEKHAFWVASQVPFDDSDAWLLIVGAGNGLITAITLDSSPFGEPIDTAQYHVLETRSCGAITVSSEDWPPINCT